MKIDAIKNGIVIDHITAGKAMQLYTMLGLDDLECTVAVIKNVPSQKMGKKDIIKIDSAIDINLEVLGYISPHVTVNFIKDSLRVDKRHIDLPTSLTNVIRCKNPRCISTTEWQIKHVFTLRDREREEYRCIYCDTAAPPKPKYYEKL
ncbi:MAG: aspartate carbamoyltransferase regulatory subunit [Eubacteriales bacterium]